MASMLKCDKKSDQITEQNGKSDWMDAVAAVAEDPTWVLDYLKPGFGVSVNGLN